MPDGLLPLFPLEVVLFPQTPLPLHIFEDRYKELIGECLARESEFGVVLVRGNGVARIGCSAAVVEVLGRHEDGKLDILTIGERRFHLNSIHSRRSFLEGGVEFFDDADFRATPPHVARAAAASYAEFLQLIGSTEEAPELHHPRLSFQLAQIATDLDFRQTLLEMRSEAERMELVAEHLALLVRRRQVADAMRKVVHSNGHGKHLPKRNNPD